MHADGKVFPNMFAAIFRMRSYQDVVPIVKVSGIYYRRRSFQKIGMQENFSIMHAVLESQLLLNEIFFMTDLNYLFCPFLIY